MAHVVNTIQSNQSTATPSAAAADASAPTNEMKTILAAVTNLSCTTPPVVAKPKTEMQQILTLLTAQAGSENAGPGGGGGNNRRRNNNGNNNNNNNRNGGHRVSVKPNIQYKFYCWSHVGLA